MEEIWKNSAIITKRNVDDNQNPISVQLSELKQIIDVHSCIVLNQLPDEFHGIYIDGYTEVYDIEKVSINNYKVDYANGVIYFHPNNIGKILNVNYYGIGHTLLSASRIYTKYDKNGNVLETLEELLDKAKLYIEAIETLGGAVEVINELKQDITNGTSLHENLLEDISTGSAVRDDLEEKTDIANATINSLVTKTQDGNNTVSQLIEKNAIATEKKQALDSSIQSATDTNTTLSNTNQAGTQINLTLQQTIAEASDDIATINATGNKSLIIGASSFTNGEYTWTHSMNNDNLIVSILSTDTNEPIIADYKIIDKNNILIRNSVEHPNLKVILSASYYQGNALFGTNVEEFLGDSIGTNGKKIRLKDDNGVNQNPITNSDAVFMPDGSTKLTNKIQEISSSLEEKASNDSLNSNITYTTNVYKSADNDLLNKIKYLTDYINNNLVTPYIFTTSDLVNVNTTSNIDSNGLLVVSKSGSNTFTWTTFNKSQVNGELEFTVNSNNCYFVLCANTTKCVAIQLGVNSNDFGLVTRWYSDGRSENLNTKETDQSRKAIIGDIIKVSRIPSGWKMTKNDEEWLIIPFSFNNANLQTEFTESEKQYGVMKYTATTNESVIKLCKFKQAILLPNSSQFSNKIWNAIGDSITWLNKYEPIVANALGLSTVRNYGKSGFSTVMLKSDIASWDNNADLISFFAGTNDFGRCDDLTTTESSVDFIFSNLKTKHPNKKIVVCLPTQRWGYTGDTVQGSQPTMTNTKGITLWQYCEVLKAKAKQYDLPVLDLYNLSGITKDNINTYTYDGLHPNDLGFQKIANIMIDFFNSL